MKILFGGRPFDPEWLIGQVFCIICVSIPPDKFHQPIMGLAEVRRDASKSADAVDAYVVEYIFSEHVFRSSTLVSIGNGLSGAALVLTISIDQNTLCDLYTDTPSPCPDRMDEVITVQELRRRAIEAIEDSF